MKETPNREFYEKRRKTYISFIVFNLIGFILTFFLFVFGSYFIGVYSQVNKIVIGGMIFFVVFMTFFGLCYLSVDRIIVDSDKSEKRKKQYEEKMKLLYQSLDRQKPFADAVDKLGIREKVYCGNDAVCISVDKIYFVNKSVAYIMDHCKYKAFEKANFNNLLQVIYSSAIDCDDVVFFSKEGDIQYTTSVYGGQIKGGGSSIGGAIVGGIIAGGVGAIIGSRQKIESEGITSVENRHDSRITNIRYKKEGKFEARQYIGFQLYNMLLKYIPEKDLLQVQLSQNRIQETDSNIVGTNISQQNYEAKQIDDTEDKLKKIKELYEKDLISKEEYDEKRKAIIDSI